MTHKARAQKIFDTKTLPHGAIKEIATLVGTTENYVSNVLARTTTPRGSVGVKVLKLAKQKAKEHLDSITI